MTLKTFTLVLISTLTLLLAACEEDGSYPENGTWEPLDCSIEETTVHTSTSLVRQGVQRETIVTLHQTVALIDADPLNVQVRVRTALADPCDGLPNCSTTVDTRVAVDGYWEYLSLGAPEIVGLPSGETRVLCTTTRDERVVVHNVGGPTATTDAPTQVIFTAEGGEILIRR